MKQENEERKKLPSNKIYKLRTVLRQMYYHLENEQHFYLINDISVNANFYGNKTKFISLPIGRVSNGFSESEYSVNSQIKWLRVHAAKY